MCGIIGVAGFENIPVERRIQMVRSGMDSMRLRGPDEQGLVQTGGAVFGHRRLSVIDVEAGPQPMVDRETGLILVYNGEIYNYQKLRHQLVTLGHTFHTHTDTEVLLKSYIEWGTDCLAALRGIFAFAVYHPKTHELFLARDRVGVKPLFYSSTPEGCVFASTLAALFRFEWIDRKICLPAFSHYLTTSRTLLGEKTLVENVYALLPGQYVFEKAGREMGAKQYWSFPVVAPADKARPDFSLARETVRELVAQAVEEQLVSDVPLGGFLSGGLDSCIIASLAREFTRGGYSAYNVGYDQAGFNEWEFVDLAARELGVPCTSLSLVPESFAPVWYMLIREKGQPLSTPNEVPIFELSRALKRDFTVALSGEGADEIFGGYTLAQFAAFDFDRAGQQPAADVLSAFEQALDRAYGRHYFDSRLDHHFLINSWMPFTEKKRFLHPDIWSALHCDSEMLAAYARLFQSLESCSTFDAYMHVHARINLEGLLSRVDSSSMAASVEARVPFTDHRLAEYLFSLPDDYRIDWRTREGKSLAQELNVAEIVGADLLESKKLLRQAFADQLPETVVNRPKMSFPVPFLEWFSGIWKDMAEEALRGADFLQPCVSDAKLEQFPLGQFSPMALWPLVNLALWQQEWGMRI